MKALNPGEPGQVGRYRLVAALGEGGMGRVLLGVAPDGRLVALKQIHPGLAHDPGFRERFRREVDTSRMVSGAYTAAVMDADPDAPTPWLASVFVPGPSLTEAVAAGGPLPPWSLHHLAAGLALALGEIHRAGLIHRDLKPSNVILAADGPRVIDFGIARAVEGSSELTHTGSIIGSPGFMSPEQAEGRALTSASDVFSLGALLAMAASGQSPFTGTSTPHTLYNVVHNQPDLRALPPGIRQIAEACLAKDPEQRPAPAWILEQLGPIAPNPHPWPPVVPQLIERQRVAVHQALHPPKPRKSRRGLAIAGAAAGVVALVAGSIVAVELTSGDEPPPAQPAAQSAPPAPAPSTPPNPDPLGTDKLRTVDPCQVLDGKSVAGIGVLKPKIDVHLWACTYTGPDGDWVDLELGNHNPIDGVPSGELAGLPLTVKEGANCEAAVPVNGRADSAIKASTSASAKLAQPCDVAKAMLTDAITRLRENPPQHEQPPGTLIPVDPCSLASATEVQPFLGPVVKVEPEDLHGCRWTVSGFLKLDLVKSHPPVQSKDSSYDVTGTVDVNGTPVYLTKEYRNGAGASCTLTWQHRPIDERSAEVVEMHHSISGQKPAPEQVCGPSLEFAKLIMPKLPKP
ncbi:serine/threonine-protein kinase [Amycolatopsis albispora]|uniref:Protein kinase n=1 Tax=Amycolatopsis albispora TaxID=1804986 RepID=A0A344LEJ0_9PSEU|nr:serine/threonine-protein kinase [Amycolatopsis albispora]AXB46464.1 protein kinase [Amycolatopsis albispora]